MDKLNFAYKNIRKYDPWKDLAKYRYTKYFEQRFLEYLENFKITCILPLKEQLGHEYDMEIDNYFIETVKKRNDQEVDRILGYYNELKFGEFDFDNELAMADLKKDIRRVKDIILASEPTDMKRLLEIDLEVDTLIDDIALHFNVSLEQEFDGIKISELYDRFKPSADLSLEEYSEYVSSFRKIVDDICEHYRKNYSVDTAAKNIKELRDMVDFVIANWNEKIDIMSLDKRLLVVLIGNAYLDWQRILVRSRSMNISATLIDYDLWVSDFRNKIEKYKADIEKRYTGDIIKKMINMIDDATGQVIDNIAKSVDYPSEHKDRFKKIIQAYKPEDIDIFNLMFYSSENDRDKAKDEYLRMSSEEKLVFEMRIYEQYIRMFKSMVRELKKDIRRVYSLKYANRVVNQINRKFDKLICDKAKKMGKSAPKNPWFARKYLWADTSSFISENGIKFRKLINPLMRNIVKVAMNNELIIEERPKLDPTKEYIFVPTHYFTEDAIGMFASLDRQAYMLMGTTDQIENNPLMLAAVMFGFFHVDRLDTASRRECVEKQNKIIDQGTSFINYVSGSWENSENELQPLSFSGPYRTSIEKRVEIVPVGLYLVREEKKIYVRYGEPMDLSSYDEKTANDIIRDTLASIHFKQMHKHCVPIETIEIEGYGLTHNLPYDQHTYYMEQVANEYWNQPWSKPFAFEEIGLRLKKVTGEEDVYAFVDNLSREKLIEMSSLLAEPLLRMDESERYDMIDYIDRNYTRLKNSKDRKVRRKERQEN